VVITLTVFSALVSIRIILAGLGTWVVGSFNPAAILPVTFGLVILAGSVLLLLPEANNGDISVIDSTFTATSATCVTGLVVRNTGTDFTFFGQAVILLMIQIGGLGLMTFVAFFALFLGQNISLRESLSMTRIMDSEFVSDLKKVLASIVGWTLTIEAAGAFILFSTWRQLRPEWTILQTLWQSIFHSISSFCNAGFSLNKTNLEGFADSPATCFTVGTLIVLGGLGFAVLTSIGAVSIHRIRTGRKRILPVHSRLVLLVTGILILGTFVFFLASEWDNTLKGMDFGQKIANSFLEAVTPRTAGFNTVPTSSLLPAVRWVFIILMFIGASPGGTGGGVKTSTVGLLFVSVISLFRRRRLPEMWKHHIPYFDVQRASVVFLLGILVFAGSSCLLLMVETDGSAEEGFTASDYVFEAASAFGTVGLSTGVTEDLSTTGRIIIILTMFLGRTGPASLAAATGRSRPLRYKYPEARITIG
jgi:trk system potassium uptake protein TrkH